MKTATLLRPTTYQSAFELQTDLSHTEMELLAALREIKNETLWGNAIKEVVKARVLEVESFRTLVCQLLSQAHDCPAVMIRILGNDCYEKLMLVK